MGRILDWKQERQREEREGGRRRQCFIGKGRREREDEGSGLEEREGEEDSRDKGKRGRDCLKIMRDTPS